MKRNWTALVASMTLIACSCASAQAKGQTSLDTFVTSIPESSPVTIEGDFYTQVSLTVVNQTFPSDKTRKKQLIASLLRAAGVAKSGSQTIAVTAKIALGSSVLPEQVLYAYKIDGNNISLQLNRTVSTPLVRLGAIDKIKIRLAYRQAREASFNLQSAGDLVARLVPSTLVVSAISEPAIDYAAKTGEQFLSSVLSGARAIDYGDEMTPYGDGPNRLLVTFNGPTGEVGRLRITLLGTPTLLRAPRSLSVGGPAASQRTLSPTERMSSLEQTVLGVPVNYLSELRKIDGYASLRPDAPSDKVSAYCVAANNELSDRLRLTSLDRIPLLYRALAGAGMPVADPARYEWVNTCFRDREERTVLALALGVDPPPPPPPPGERLPEPLLWAFGCWMQKSPYPDCQTKAPSADALLASQLADKVQVTIDSKLLPSPIGDGESASRDQIVLGLKGTVTTLHCMGARGMYLKNDADEVFRLGGKIDRRRMTELDIRRVATLPTACGQG